MDNPDNNQAPLVGENQNQTELPEQLEATSFKQPQKPKKSKKKIVTILIIVLLLLVAVCVGYFLFFKYEQSEVGLNEQNTDSVQLTETSNEDEVIDEYNVSEYLLESPQRSNGIAIGYVEKNAESVSSSFLSPKASAAEILYEPIVFYQKDSNIFSINTVTKETQQVTTGGGDTPAFSSKSQKLAYALNCEIFVKDYKSGELISIAKGENSYDTNNFSADASCYYPIAWSPDGSRLAIAGNYSLNNTEIGLVGFTDIYIYDFSNGEMDKIDAPEGFNSIPSIYDALWINNESILTTFIKRGAFAAEEARQLMQVNISDSSTQSVNSNYAISTNETKLFAKNLITIGESPREMLYSDSADFSNLQQVSGTENVGSYLLKINGSELNDIYMLIGQPGSENSFSLDKVTLGGDKESLYKPEGFSAYMLGWGLNYDEVIYMATLSGKSEIHQYTISTNTNVVLVQDLPLQ